MQVGEKLVLHCSLERPWNKNGEQLSWSRDLGKREFNGEEDECCEFSTALGCPGL